MRYLQLKPYGELERVTGRPVTPPTACSVCGKVKGRGDTDLVVRFVDQPPYPDALGVLFGQEWAASRGLRDVFDSKVPNAVQYADLHDEAGKLLEYRQVLLQAALHADHQSIRGGDTCEVCGGYVQLNLDPLYLRKPSQEEPPLAYLSESPAIILVREDVADAVREGQLDVQLLPVLFQGEQPPNPGPTSDQGDWSDLKS